MVSFHVLEELLSHLERCLILRRFFCKRRVRFLSARFGTRDGATEQTVLSRDLTATQHNVRIFFHFQRNLDLAWSQKPSSAKHIV